MTTSRVALVLAVALTWSGCGRLAEESAEVVSRVSDQRRANIERYLNAASKAEETASYWAGQRETSSLYAVRSWTHLGDSETQNGRAYRYRIESSTRGGQPIVKVWRIDATDQGIVAITDEQAPADDAAPALAADCVRKRAKAEELRKEVAAAAEEFFARWDAWRQRKSDIEYTWRGQDMPPAVNQQILDKDTSFAQRESELSGIWANADNAIAQVLSGCAE